MAAHHPASVEPDSGTDSVTSTPRAIHKSNNNDNNQPPPPRIRLMCSFGGKILPRPHDNQLRYVGGDTRIVAVSRSASFSSLVSKLSKLTGALPGDFSVKYQLPNEDLDALITVSTDEDVDNMMEEWDRFTSSSASNKTARLRLFLFPNNSSAAPSELDSRASSISSLLDGSTKRESWFLDALNGGRADLERGRSEVSSIVSEVPDYLFGLDNSEDPNIQSRMMESRLLKNTRAMLAGDIPGSDPGSPMVTASPFCSSSSAPACVPTTPNLNLPPVKTKPSAEVLSEVLSEPGSAGEVREVRAVPVQAPPQPPQVTSGYPGVAPVWAHPGHGPSPYAGHAHAHVQAIPVYYVPAPGPGQGPVQQVPGQYMQQQYQMPPGQVPMGYHPAVPGPGVGQMYTGPVRPAMASPEQYHHDMQGRVVGGGGGPNQPVYYGVRGGGGGYPGYPGMVMGAASEEVQGTGPDGSRAGPV